MGSQETNTRVENFQRTFRSINL